MNNRIEEIQSFLTHRDCSLVRRRILDLSLDSDDSAILKRAIAWSQTYSHQLQENSSIEPEEFVRGAEELLLLLYGRRQSIADLPQPLLTAKGVGKRYAKGNFSLQPMDVTISTGNISGVVGENGNGKTTLLRCLAGQLAIDQGTIEYRQLRNPDYYSIKSHVAFIPQRIPRWFGLLKDNLHFSASLSGVKEEENEMMVSFMLERLNLTRYAHLTWNQISSGYRTRFEIARVLLQMPRLLILDEPLANLDINAQQTLLTDLGYLAKSSRHPMGILLSSQQLHEVEKIADVVYFLKQGTCLYNTGNKKQVSEINVIEIESKAERADIARLFSESDVQIHFNGSYYTMTSTRLQPRDMIATLLQHDIDISYYRNITHSTKRFF